MQKQRRQSIAIGIGEMPGSLLLTKLYVPLTPLEFVSRPRLVERLAAGIHKRLILISAPAGFGKTTLLCEVLNKIDHPVAWVSLDERDNDPGQFWTYLITALQTFEPDLGRSALSMLQTSKPPPMESILTGLINEITMLAPEFVLVLDDYHAIGDHQPIHEALAFLIDYLPPHVHLVISSRTDPPLYLSRLRGRGQLTELRANDLRFTQDETAIFLKEVMSLKLSDEQVAALEARTEGWIASLQMAAVSMQGRKDIHDFIADFSGTHHYIMDYLTQEVLNRQPENIQSFLLETSILNRLIAPLCDAVTRQNDSETILQQLEAANLFLVPMDSERRWFRYHHLFAEQLRSQLEKAKPDLLPILHGRASEWFENQGQVEDAIHHALSAEDMERAADLIDPVAVAMVRENKFSMMADWMAKLPDDLVADRLWLCFSGALAYHFTGQLDALEMFLWHAEARLAGTDEARPSDNSLDHARIRGIVTALRARIAFEKGDIPGTLQLCGEGLKNHPEDELLGRSLMKGILGAAYWAKGELETANHYIEEAVKLAAVGGHLHLSLMCSTMLAIIQIEHGHLHKAKEICEDAILIGTKWSSDRPLPATGGAHVFLGEVLYQWNRLDEAREHVNRGVELSEQGIEAMVILKSHVLLAQLNLAQGAKDPIPEMLLKALNSASEASRFTSSLTPYSSMVRLLLAHGDLTAAADWVDSWSEHLLSLKGHPDSSERSNVNGDLPNFWYDVYCPIARLRFTRNELDGILDDLDDVQKEMETRQRTPSLIEVLILESMILQAQGKVDQALVPLERALSLAEPEGYIRIFADEGKPMLKLLNQASSRGIAPDYVSRLVGAFNGLNLGKPDSPEQLETKTSPTPPSARDSSGLIESLTEREIETLHLISEGLSNEEIGETLYISITTVKTHIRSLYGKLNVNRRTQAIQRARDLGLL